MLKPAVVFTLTVDVIVPAVLVDVVPAPACHCHATKLFALSLIVAEPIENPFALNEVSPVATVSSTSDKEVYKTRDAPRTESNTL